MIVAFRNAPIGRQRGYRAADAFGRFQQFEAAQGSGPAKANQLGRRRTEAIQSALALGPDLIVADPPALPGAGTAEAVLQAYD